MKLIVQIPCYNEAATLPRVVADIPRTIPGVDIIEILVIDDGSADGTSQVARQCGVEHVVRHTRNRGLAAAFRTGLDACVQRGADVIVNMDGDGQHPGVGIPELIRPVIEGRLDVVVGARPIEQVKEYSALKKWLQRWGSRAVRSIAGVDIPDATSGFRAFSREAALRINIFSRFTYTLESLIQCGHSGIAVGSVPVPVNPKTRESRLFKSDFQYIMRSAHAMLRIYTWYRPLRLFWGIGAVFLGIGGLLGLRHMVLAFIEHEVGAGRVQSLLLAAVLIIAGILFFLVGLVADMTATNRRIGEEVLYRARKRDAHEASQAQATQA